MKKKGGWYVVGVLILGLALLVISCGGEASTSVEESATDEPAVEETITEEPTTEESVVEAAVAEGPPNIPAGHATAGCPVCHEQGIGDAPKWPDNHAGYTEQICTSCHQPESK